MQPVPSVCVSPRITLFMRSGIELLWAVPRASGKWNGRIDKGIKRHHCSSWSGARIHCDNVTSFFGADRELRVTQAEFLSQFNSKNWENYCPESGIKFRIIQIYLQHFSGIQEGGVKS